MIANNFPQVHKDYNQQRLIAQQQHLKQNEIAIEGKKHLKTLTDKQDSEANTSHGDFERIEQAHQNNYNNNEGQLKEEEDNQESEASSSLDQLNSDIKENRFGNVEVSLFWEEKFIMIIRFVQFYGYLMMICFEEWPYSAREQWSGFFFFMIGSFQFMSGVDQYYELIQSFEHTLINLGCYLFVLFLIIGIWLLVYLDWRLHYRLLKQSRKRINYFKWAFYFLEIIHFPLILNIIQYSTCQYNSFKEAIQVVNCSKQNSTYYPFMLFVAFFSFIAAIIYNLMIGIHLYREKVSNLLHEEYVKKKEIEYCVGVSEMWNSRYFYTFSSFKGELVKMYHRLIFNGIQLLFILIHALMPESQAKLGVVVGLFALFDFYVLATRPYRCLLSNILLFMLTSSLLITTFLLLLKKGGMNSALFVDNYFYGLLIIVNSFCWVLIFAFVILIYMIKRRWMITKEGVLKAIQGQEFVIFQIKKARRFKSKVTKQKSFGEKEKKTLHYLMKVLGEQFNHFRDRQPIIMDALLETIEALKEMKKNYDDNPFLYNYDYKEELRSLVKSRYRIYEIKNI